MADLKRLKNSSALYVNYKLDAFQKTKSSGISVSASASNSTLSHIMLHILRKEKKTAKMVIVQYPVTRNGCFQIIYVYIYIFFVTEKPFDVSSYRQQVD